MFVASVQYLSSLQLGSTVSGLPLLASASRRLNFTLDKPKANIVIDQLRAIVKAQLESHVKDLKVTSSVKALLGSKPIP